MGARIGMTGCGHRPRPFEARQRITTEDGLSLALERFGPEDGAPVLLLHGASAASDTFFLPDPRRCLVTALVDAGHQVWALDGRASFHVLLDSHRDPAKAPPRERFRLEAAEQDLDAALAHITEARPGRGVAILAHCLGAGLVAQAVARGRLERWPIASLTLVALGLFFRTAAEGIIKAQDRLLQRLRAASRPRPWLSPHDDADWTGRGDLARSYRVYVDSPLARGLELETFRRLSFMYGRPYLPERVPPSVHTASELARQFGPMHLEPYLQGTANIRRGWAADWGASPRDRSLLDPEPFRRRPVTLLTGGRNPLWHRDAIDRMHAFLRRADGPAAKPARKHVVRGYGHQDLFWGDAAAREVFPRLLEGVRA